MTLCALCHKDRPNGRINPTTNEWECGRCNPAGSVAMNPNRGNRRPRP